jgi:hypothetical protein
LSRHAVGPITRLLSAFRPQRVCALAFEQQDYYSAWRW